MDMDSQELILTPENRKKIPLPDPVDTRMHILLLKCAFKVIYSKTTFICML